MNPELDSETSWIEVEWPVPDHVRAGTTTRIGGTSPPPYSTFNLALHVGDDPEAVLTNRRRLRQRLGLPAEPQWLNQRHGGCVVDIGGDRDVDADGAYTNQPGKVCCILTADCIPLLLTNAGGTEIAAVHVGWRGLCAGVAISALQRFAAPPRKILAWLGPHIGPAPYVVGDDVRCACRTALSGADRAFTRAEDGRWHGGLADLLRLQLRELGLVEIQGCPDCTFQDSGRFFSYRRERTTGRMASLIWIAT